MFSLFRLYQKDEISFDIIAETGNIVAKNGNNVEASFDIVERIVQLVAFNNVAWTLLLVWTGLNAIATEAGRRTDASCFHQVVFTDYELIFGASLVRR